MQVSDYIPKTPSQSNTPIHNIAIEIMCPVSHASGGLYGSFSHVLAITAMFCSCNANENHINIFRASRGWLSFGQYGHLNRLPLHSRFSDSSAITCPQGIIIGGFWSVACSFDTGQTKIEWKRYDGGSGISTWNRLTVILDRRKNLE